MTNARPTDYEFTAFSEDSLGGHVGKGSTFTMPAGADICITVTDNDAWLSGDKHDKARDHSFQTATIEADGTELGNGGQVYAEKYFWVVDQNGAWYILIEIEQEGTKDDYFTFFTGGGYSVPPEGAHLTVKSVCNIRGVCYDDLDGGPKDSPDTGTISGTVFCDTDCDGINGTTETVPGETIVIEAEDMHERGFRTAHGNKASDGELIKLNHAGGDGKLWTDFKGKTGTYDVKIRVQDENDGQSVLKLKIDGQFVEAVKLDGDNNGRGSDNGEFSTYVIRDVAITKGDELRINVDGDGGEFARIDKITLKGAPKTVTVEEPVKAGVTIKLLDAAGAVVATTVTDANGNYAFTGVPEGDYTIMGVAPDGTEFTVKDAGSDDSVDSDVDANGMSGTITVTGGSTTDVDLGVCDTQTGTISGTVFHDTDCDGLNGGSDLFPAWAQDISNVVFYYDRDGDGEIDFSVKIDEFPDGGGAAFISNDLDDFFGQMNAFIVAQVPGLSPDSTVAGVSIKGGTQPTTFYPVEGNLDGPTRNTGPGNDVELDYGDFFSTYTPGDSGGLGAEPGKAGVTIKLLDAAGAVVATTVTDANGDYAFTGVPVGDYTIMGVAPDGTEFTVQDAGSDDSVDSDVDATGTSGTISVTAGSETDVDLGVCDKPFVECDDPHAVKIDFEGFAKGTVMSTQYAGVVIEAQRDRKNTPENDAMVFDSANPTGGDTDLATTTQGNILIVSEDNDSSDPDDAIGGTITFTFENPASIFDLKVIDTEEGGTITLKGSDGTVIATVAIPQIGDGDIAQVLIDTDGVAQMEVELNGSGAIDDLCYVPGKPELGSLSGKYFFDGNRDGLDTDGANGIAGITVALLDAAGTPTGATTTTAADGSYSFTGLAAGTYGVQFTDPDTGRVLTTQNVDGDISDAIDSDAADLGGGVSEITGITVVAGADTPDNDAGVVEQLGSLSGRYFEDLNDNDVDDGEPGIAGVVVELLDASGTPTGVTTTTAADGSYSFSGLVPGDYGVQFSDPSSVLAGKQLVDPNVGGDDSVDSDAVGDTTLSTITSITVTAGQDTPDNDAGAEQTASLGDFVFEDANADGVQDAGELGIANVLVTLTGGGTDGVIGTTDDTTATTLTDANGRYAFTGLNPGEEYQVTFEQPAGLEVSPVDQGGDDSADSDGLVAPVVTLAPGENNTTIDQGFFQLAGLGDFVFEDLDGDGIQDAGEPGVDGVEVALKDENGTTIDTTFTSGGGAYSFTGLIPGTYSVVFTAPAGFAFTAANAGADDGLDSDADPVSGMTQQVTLTSGEFNGTLDAGLVVPNTPPTAADDALKLCADAVKTIDILGNDTDLDGDLLTVDEFVYLGADGVAGGGDDVVIAADGTPVTLATGAVVSFDGTDFTYDVTGADSFDGVLGLGAQAIENFAYTISDGNGGTASAAVDVTVCGTASVETVAALVEGTTVTYTVTQPGTAAGFIDGYTLQLTASSSTDIPTGTYELAYCLDLDQLLQTGVQSSGTILVATEANATAVGMPSPENIDAINWLLNNDQTLVDNGDGTGDTYTDIEVQEAIWTLINEDTFVIGKFPSVPEYADDQNGVRDGAEIGTLENIDEIVQAALTNGDGFEPGDGDIFGLIIEPIDPASQDQPFIIGIQYECLC